jgi:hypothetical protein
MFSWSFVGFQGSIVAPTPDPRTGHNEARTWSRCRGVRVATVGGGTQGRPLSPPITRPQPPRGHARCRVPRRGRLALLQRSRVVEEVPAGHAAFDESGRHGQSAATTCRITAADGMA